MTWRADRHPDAPAGHVPSLDGLRGAAILAVLVHHCYPSSSATSAGRAMAAAIDAGWVGVELFFVLSGFLITGILCDTRGRPDYYGEFYRRRFVRIVPLYASFLVVYQGVALFAARRLADGTTTPRAATWPIWLFLTNMPQVAPVGPLMGSLGPLWSLAVEVQIYLIWPVLVARLPRGQLVGVLAWLVPIAAVGRTALLAGWGRVDIACCWTPAFLDEFAAGGIVAILVRDASWRDRLREHSPRVMVASGLVLSALAVRLGHFHVWRDTSAVLGIGRTLMAILFAATIAHLVTTGLGSSSSSILTTALTGRVLPAMGRRSFAIYLLHTPIYAALRPYLVLRLGRTIVSYSLLSGGLIFLASAASTYLAASLTRRFLEVPLSRLAPRRRCLSPREKRPVVGTIAS